MVGVIQNNFASGPDINNRNQNFQAGYSACKAMFT